MEVIFESPATDDNDARVFWMHTTPDEDTLVETVMDHLPDPQSPEPFSAEWHVW